MAVYVATIIFLAIVTFTCMPTCTLFKDFEISPESFTKKDRDVGTLHVQVDKFAENREAQEPDLKLKKSWSNRKYALHLFAKHFISMNKMEHMIISEWWDELTHHQQKLRHKEFRRFFNYLMARELTPKLKYNPFTTNDDVPRLLLRSKPERSREDLSQEKFEKIHTAAGRLEFESLQLAMEISRYTTLRRSDVCGLRFDQHVKDGWLRVVVSKSEAQKGTARATRLEWRLNEHPELSEIIDRCQRLSARNHHCPFVISHEPKRKVWNQNKEHFRAVTPERLSRMFKEAKDEACIDENVTFHCIRGLSATLLINAGYDPKQVQEIMAHESINTTKNYMDADSLDHTRVDLRLR